MAGYAADLILKTKLCPRNLRGVLPLTSATEMQITTASRAWAPLPPGNVKLNNLAYASWPTTTTGDVTLSWSHRNRVTQGVGSALVAQDVAGSYAIEGTLTIKAYVDGVLKRTWLGLTGTSQVYTLAQRTADNADLSKPVYFTITPINGAYTGTIRTTPPFVMG
jgi:hypothetical protein